MWLDDLTELVGTLEERIEQHKDVLGRNETATRYALIDPLPTALGWDLQDPGQVQTEYSTGDGRADYAMLAGGDTSRATAYKIIVPSIPYLGSHRSTPPGYASS